MRLNINPEIEKLPYRIWYRIRDDEGNVLSTGVHTKTYKRYANAWNVATKQYAGKAEYYVSRLNPFQDHTEDLTCELCKSEFSVRLVDTGYRLDYRFRLMNEGYTVYDWISVCPACYLSILDHIENLKKEKKKDEYSKFK